MNRLGGSKILLAQQDLFTRSDDLPHSPFLRAIGHAVCFIALLIFGYVALSSFKYAYPPSSLEAIGLVRKEIAPVKIAPENPGGEQFLNQDKFIYNSLEDKAQRKDNNRELVLKETKISDKPEVKKVVENKSKELPQIAKSQSANTSVKGDNPVKQTRLPEPQVIAKNPSKKLDSVFDVLE